MNVHHKPRKGPDGLWVYPSREDALAECGLKPIDAYIRARRDTIARYVVDRPIFEACREGERKRGTSPRQYWWEQTMEFPEATEEEAVEAEGDPEEGLLGGGELGG